MFDQSDEDGRVVLLTAQPDPATLDAVREAVGLCPSRALALSHD